MPRSITFTTLLFMLVMAGVGARDPDAAPVRTARADWLVCKEICIPEGADLSLSLPVIADGAQVQRDARWSDAIAKARASLPRPADGWSVTATGRGSTVELHLVSKAVPAPGRES